VHTTLIALGDTALENPATLIIQLGPHGGSTAHFSDRRDKRRPDERAARIEQTVSLLEDGVKQRPKR
jgi:hypothetical protein